MTSAFTPEQVEHLRRVLEEDIDRQQDHREWLTSEAAKDEQDRELQIAETGGEPG
jgi:hypothetical protein